MDEEIYIPKAEELQKALISFVLTVGAITFGRGQERGPKRFSYIAKQLANEFAKRFNLQEAELIISEFKDYDSMSSLGALYEELVYITWKYRRHTSNIEIELPPIGEATFGEETGDIFDDQTVKDIGTVKSSISTLMSKLPKWAQRILDVILEALKLTRGG